MKVGRGGPDCGKIADVRSVSGLAVLKGKNSSGHRHEQCLAE
ncbi:MAG: hypothetical protein Ct9H300mP1_34190 [Planctomycetaceae bacterium]|nr:MAG: hypothetical protein Ct9H300mP1_34190 [Planctomycetaceae bacterium]